MRNTRFTYMKNRSSIILVVVLTMAVGCSQQKKEPPTPYAGPVLRADEFDVQPSSCFPTGFEILETEHSQGRFPCAISVANLVPSQEDVIGNQPKRAWWIGAMKEEKATYWTSLFNTVSDIREVVILDQLNLEWPDDDLSKVIQAAERMKTMLCLVYGPTDADLGHAALLGVLMDILSGKPSAIVRADAGPADFRSAGDDQIEGDLLSGKIMGGPDHEKFQTEVKTLISQGYVDILLDMAKVSWVNSTGLGILVSAYHTLKKNGGTLKICKVSDRIDNILNVTQLKLVFETFTDCEEALASFEQG